MALPTPWSYTSLSTFLQCARRYYLTRVAKLVREQPTEATTWGTAVHAALETRVRDGTPLPATMQQFEPTAQEVLSWSDRWQCEERFGLTENLEPTEFFAPDVWCRGVLDLVAVHGRRAVVADHKTGKRRPDLTQLKLFAAATFAKHPRVDTVRTAFLWLNYGTKSVETFTRKDLGFIWKYFLPQIRRLESAHEKDRWPPNPSPLCGWCPVGSGHCEHWRART